MKRPHPETLIFTLGIITGAAFVLILLGGCTVDGRIEDPGVDWQCTDTRDGEQFVLQLDTMTNIRAGIGAPSCFDALDTDGNLHTVCSGHEAWLKCVDVERELQAMGAVL